MPVQEVHQGEQREGCLGAEAGPQQTGQQPAQHRPQPEHASWRKTTSVPVSDNDNIFSPIHDPCSVVTDSPPLYSLAVPPSSLLSCHVVVLCRNNNLPH